MRCRSNLPRFCKEPLDALILGMLFWKHHYFMESQASICVYESELDITEQTIIWGHDEDEIGYLVKIFDVTALIWICSRMGDVASKIRQQWGHVVGYISRIVMG